jgi:hypothetical protein
MDGFYQTVHKISVPDGFFFFSHVMSSIHVMPPSFTTSIRFFSQPKSQPSVSFDSQKNLYREKPWPKTSQPSLMLADLRSHFRARVVMVSNREKREGIIGRRSI